MKTEHVAWGIARLSLGWIFFWAFWDKLLGLGFSTAADKAWVLGNSPTYGFLAFGTSGPFADLFKIMAGNFYVDLLFMGGLLLIGGALILGIGMRIAGYAGALLMVFMYLAVLPKEHAIFIDEHVVYAALLILMAHLKVGQYYGLGKWWAKQSFVKQNPFLE
jgi:thiosulfate dehydrogenase [quinone] large subunit